MKVPTDKKDPDKSPHAAAERDEQSQPGKDDHSKSGKATTLDGQGDPGTDKQTKTGMAAVVPKSEASLP